MLVQFAIQVLCSGQPPQQLAWRCNRYSFRDDGVDDVNLASHGLSQRQRRLDELKSRPKLRTAAVYWRMTVVTFLHRGITELDLSHIALT